MHDHKRIIAKATELRGNGKRKQVCIRYADGGALMMGDCPSDAADEICRRVNREEKP